ncbi:MAG: imidazole glycerol phosphate synthase subunit HisH [Gemmatimonadales bacterium]|nr:imidazole glycerol phosphate synthase subunit HisH [Gemmatimonadales bacterium]
MTPLIAIVSTGTANVASMEAGLRRAGAETFRTSDPEQVADAMGVVIPGVGTFAAAMTHLRQTGMDDALRARFRSGRPVLAVCLGLQLLARTSEESPGEEGLGIVDADVVGLPEGASRPQLGWNEVIPSVPGYVERGHAYFANSYCLRSEGDAWQPSHAHHGDQFIAAMQRDRQLACQFHPELSGAWGVALLTRWIGTC